MLPGTNHRHGDAGAPLATRNSGRRLASPEARIRKLSKPQNTRGKKSAILNLAVMAVVVPGLFCTVALPAYAFQDQQDGAAEASEELQALKESGAQTVAVSDDLVAAALTRDDYTTTSAAEMQRTALAAAYRAYSGPSVSDYLANPPYPNFDLNQVVAVAKQYQGVPYVSGGADPSGFDCSGFTQYVYAQFGIALPHSASRQSSGGTAISAEDALPGDLVFMDGSGHVGIYLGGNMMIDAGTPRTNVSIREIYNPNHWFVRYGI